MRDLSPSTSSSILYGSGAERITLRLREQERPQSASTRAHYEGVIPNLERRFKETDSDYIREDLERYMAPRPCPTCRARG